MMRVGAVRNASARFASRGGRVLCVHGGGCAEHVWQLGGESPLPSQMEAKG
jgi:hypothetical protein